MGTVIHYLVIYKIWELNPDPLTPELEFAVPNWMADQRKGPVDSQTESNQLPQGPYWLQVGYNQLHVKANHLPKKSNQAS